jgi:hypothetical protein
MRPRDRMTRHAVSERDVTKAMSRQASFSMKGTGGFVRFG